MTRTRFAPAPTGLLHLGHVVSALYVWGFGHAMGAEVLLRIEDHDRQRSRPEFERALLDDLDWLGFVPDRFRTDAFRAGPCHSRQSDRGPVYARAAEQLAAQGVLYACDCSRQQRERAREITFETEQACPGGCEARGLPLAGPVSWQVRLPAEPQRFIDLLRGPLAQVPARTVAIRDRLGNWTYQFAVTVDDLDQQIDLVIRGEDLLGSTGTQLGLAGLLGRAVPPVFAHHPLVMHSADRKLSKSDGATGIRALREAGWPASAVIEEAARRVRRATGNSGT